MGLFAIDLDELKKLDSLRDFAEKPENIFRPGGGKPPGNDPSFVRALDAVGFEDGVGHRYRVVFTITENKGKRFRQASFSLDKFVRKKYPHPHAVQIMCMQLGYTGSLKDWFIYQDPEMKGAIVVCQELRGVGTA